MRLGILLSFVVGSALWFGACGGDSFESTNSGGKSGTGASASTDSGVGGGSGDGGGAGSSSGGGGSGGCGNVQSDPLNCGSCGTVCPQVTNGTPSCIDGVCGVKCSAPFADCDMDATNGCEVNTSSDTGNCSACGTECDAPPADATGLICSTSSCECAGERAKCTAFGKPACVNAAKDPRFCGSGCTTCSDGDGCQNGSCFTPSCPYGQTFCSLDNKCHNLKTDWATCGSCGKTCDFDESCVDGACLTKGGLPCNLLTQCVDNCTNLNADSANCGQCSTPSIYHGCANGEACMAGLCKKLPLAAEPWECGPGKVACNIPADWPTKPAPYYCWTTNCPLGGNPVTPGG